MTFHSTVLPLLLSIAACILLYQCGLAGAGPDTNEKSHFCNTRTLPIDSGEVRDIIEILQYAVDTATGPGFNSYSAFNGYHARASCRTTISVEDCSDCLDYANNKLYQICSLMDGGQITQADCRLRFEHYDFGDNW